jgi:purine-binding chemotaxis protein CheW
MQNRTVTEKAAKSSDGLAGKFLTVLLEGVSYGIPVLRVREIIRLSKITTVPQTPPWVSGVINLRGRVIAVIDLRVKFGLRRETTEHTCIVVVDVPVANQPLINLGLVVDSVDEVVNVTAEDIESPPDFGVKVDTEYLLGMAKTKSRVCMLLQIDRVVASDSLASLGRMAS